MSTDEHEIEVNGPDVDTAINSALHTLGVTRDQAVVIVVDEGSRGMLGLGRRDAIVRVRPIDPTLVASQPEPPAVADAPAATAISEPTETPEPAARPAVMREVKPKKPKKPKAEKHAAVSDAGDQPTSEATTPAAKKPKQSPKKPKKAAVESAPLSGEEAADIERETEVARTHLEKLLELMQVDATVTTDTSERDDMTERIVPILKVTGDNVSNLIGSRGKTLNSMQALLRHMSSQTLRQRTNFVLDIGGYRERRLETLENLAKRMAKRAVKENRPMTLNAMPPHERRVIHMTLRNDETVVTRSNGEGDRRRVRILPRK